MRESMRMVRAAPAERRRALARSLYRDDPGRRPRWVDTELLRPGQVALLFHVSRRTVSDWARAGHLPSILTPGGHRRFPARDVRALLEASRSDATIDGSRPPVSVA